LLTGQEFCSETLFAELALLKVVERNSGGGELSPSSLHAGAEQE
jgi:hypothetical protein